MKFVSVRGNDQVIRQCGFKEHKNPCYTTVLEEYNTQVTFTVQYNLLAFSYYYYFLIFQQHTQIQLQQPSKYNVIEVVKGTIMVDSSGNPLFPCFGLINLVKKPLSLIIIGFFIRHFFTKNINHMFQLKSKSRTFVKEKHNCFLRPGLSV